MHISIGVNVQVYNSMSARDLLLMHIAIGVNVQVYNSMSACGLLLMHVVIGVNMQVYTTSNIMMSIQIVSTRIDVIGLATVILTMQSKSN